MNLNSEKIINKYCINGKNTIHKNDMIPLKQTKEISKGILRPFGGF